MLAVEARNGYPKLCSMAMMGEKDLFQQMAAFWVCRWKVNGALDDEEIKHV